MVSKDEIYEQFIGLDYSRAREQRELTNYYEQELVNLQTLCENNGGHEYVKEFGDFLKIMPSFGEQRQVCKYCKKVKK